MKCAIYARFSSDNQNPKSAKDQIYECKQYALKNDWIVVKVYKDEAKSGGSVIGREEFSRMINDSEKELFNLVLVEDSDRFSRDFFDGLYYLKQLSENGIKVADIKYGILDITSFEGQVIQAVRFASNQNLIRQIGEKTKRGQRAQTRSGFSSGGHPPYGYFAEITNKKAMDPRNRGENLCVKFIVNQKQAEIVRKIYELYANGSSLRQIAFYLNNPERKIISPRNSSWDVSYIRDILRNEVYLGRMIYGRSKKVKRKNGKRSKIWIQRQDWEIKENAHEPIISQELWDRVRKRVEENLKYSSKGLGAYKIAYSRYLLSGLLECSLCGGNFIIVNGRKKRENSEYGCGYEHNRGKHVCANKLRVKKNKLEDVLFKSFEDALMDENFIEFLKQEVNKSLAEEKTGNTDGKAELQKIRTDKEKEINNCLEFIAKYGNTSEAIKNMLLRLEKEKEGLDSQLREFKVKKAKIMEIKAEEIKDYLKSLKDLLSINPVLARQEISKSIDGKIKMIPVGLGTSDEHLEAEYIAYPRGILEKSGLQRFAYSGGAGRPDRMTDSRGYLGKKIRVRIF